MRRIIAAMTHRDSDLALLLVLAATTMVLQFVAGDLLAALFAATICSLCASMLRLRRTVQDLSDRRRGVGSLFLAATPAELSTRIDTASTALLVGVSLDRTVRNNFSALEHYLRRGGLLRVLVVDPNDQLVVEVADRRAYNEHGIEGRIGQIELSIQTLEKLAALTGGRVEIRTIKDPLTFGAVMLDAEPPTSRSWIMVQHYSYKKAAVTEANPIFMLTESDGEWFLGFREEILNLWRDSTPYADDNVGAVVTAEPGGTSAPRVRAGHLRRDPPGR